MTKKKLLSVLVVFCMVCALLPTSAYAEENSHEITSAEDLMAVLKMDKFSDTQGQIYTLMNDIEIDTSTLDTSFVSQQEKRIFAGTLDGNDHTITVQEAEDGSPSKPLFDALCGTSGSQLAAVKNLKVVFKGNVYGTTIAASFGNAEISNVAIEFEKDIQFADSGSYAVATGVVGRIYSGKSELHISNVTVTATGRESYGVIGSQETYQDKTYVMAAGVYSEDSNASRDFYLNDITVDVRGIYARSKAVDSGPYSNAACVAAGAVAGEVQFTAHLSDVHVKVRDNISAKTSERATSDADAYGLAWKVKAMYNCTVDVGGNIEALSYGFTSPQRVEYGEGQTTCTSAVGMCYTLMTRDNTKNSTGTSYVKVGGDIRARSLGTGTYPYSTYAGGVTCIDSWKKHCENITVQVDGNIASYNEHGKDGAIAAGFSAKSDGSYDSGSTFARSGCTVKAGSITAEAVNADASAVGFAYYDFLTSENCSVDVGTIHAITHTQTNEEACSYTAGFSFFTRTFPTDRTVTASGCTVQAEKLIAEGHGNAGESVAAGFACGAAAYNGGYTYQIKDCNVTANCMQADNQVGLFIAQNIRFSVDKRPSSLASNTVTLPKSAVDIVEINGEQYVRFTASEVDGRAAEHSAWESGNQLILTEQNTVTSYTVSCAFDDGDADGTLWKLTESEKFYAVNYDLNGGTGYGYDREYVLAGDYTLKAAPKNGEREFLGWSDGSAIHQPGGTVKVTGPITFTAQWKPDEITITFDPNDGSVTPKSVRLTPGSALSGLPVPTRSGSYAFDGWYTERIGGTKVDTGTVFRKSTTLYAHWTYTGGGSHDHDQTSYALRYESNGGTVYRDEHYGYGTMVKLEKAPTREGYTFTGWYADAKLTEKIESIKMTSNKIVYAGWKATETPAWFNDQDHFAYVMGYTDGTVRPNRNITRAEVAMILYRLLNADVRASNMTTVNSFEDVAEDLWCNTAISTLAKLGVFRGRTVDFFDPDAPITRAEFAMVCSRFDQSEIEAGSHFSDISGHWAQTGIERAAAIGWVQGYQDGTFRPENRITRAQAVTMINRVLRRLPETDEDLLPDMKVWPDNPSSAWHYLAMQEATNGHDYTRKDNVHEQWIVLHN